MNAISALTTSPVAAPIVALVVGVQLNVVVVRSVNPTECQLNSVITANTLAARLIQLIENIGSVKRAVIFLVVQQALQPL